MAIERFAAIDIGSYNISMEIFELSKKNGLNSVNHIRQRLEIGKDTYQDGKLSREKIEKLCRILLDFKVVMEEYKVSDYRACAKSAFREAENMVLVVDLIFQRTGIKVDVLSNSEQRFLGYKAIASKESDFNKIIEKGTAIIDMGGGSVQVSLFDKDALVTTQNIQVGSMRTREHLAVLGRETTKPELLVDELIRKDIQSFKRLYLKDRKIENVILVGDYFTNLIFHNKTAGSKTITKETFMQWYRDIIGKSALNLSIEMDVPMEFASVILPTAVIYRRLIDELGADTIWLPGIQLTDGIAYDYGEKNQIIRTKHDFENDIVMAAKNIAKRYGSSQKHTQYVAQWTEVIFDSVKKVSNMTARERLLLRIACMLHDCGKYISLLNVAESSYNIIMSTEIIGLSHLEREIIANVLRYNVRDFDYNQVQMEANLDNISSSYGSHKDVTILIAKLTAILRLADSMDRAHKQTLKDCKMEVKDGMLVVRTAYPGDMTLDAISFEQKASFFEEIFGIRPMLKRKRSV